MEKVVYLEQEETLEQQIDKAMSDVARVVYEANRAYCATMGDYTLQPWDLIGRAEKDSWKLGAAHYVKASGCSPAELHNVWFEEQVKEGWSLGPEIDFAHKTHPCLLPWFQLPVDQRMRALLFYHVVQAHLDVYNLGVQA